MKWMGWSIALLICANAASAASPPAVYDKKCALCHSIAGVGGKKAEVGGPLDGVGSKRDAAWLRQYTKDPKSAMPEAKMPKLPLTDAELDELVKFMVELK